MFKTIRIKHFRGIKDLKIDNLKKINIFVGDNATGKTAVLDAVYIAINPGNPDLPRKTNIWRNLGPITSSFWKSLFYNFYHKNEIEIEAIKNSNDKIKINIKPLISTTMVVSKENRYNKELEAGSNINKSLNGLELSFQIGASKYKSSIEQVQDRLNLNPSKNYQETLQGHYFNNITYSSEINLAEKFDTVNQEIGKEPIIEFLQNFKTGIKDIELDRFHKLLVKDTSFGNKRIHLNTYGDGMVRGLHILLDILIKKDGVTLIDEIENGLHWSKQEIIWKFIHKIVEERNQQLFITTHSIEMLSHLYKLAKKKNFIDMIKLYRLQSVKGDIKIVPYNAKQIEFAITHEEEIR